MNRTNTVAGGFEAHHPRKIGMELSSSVLHVNILTRAKTKRRMNKLELSCFALMYPGLLYPLGMLGACINPYFIEVLGLSVGTYCGLLRCSVPNLFHY